MQSQLPHSSPLPLPLASEDPEALASFLRVQRLMMEGGEQAFLPSPLRRQAPQLETRYADKGITPEVTAAAALGAVPVHMLPDIKNRLKKTKVCKHFLRGCCHYAEKCAFAHTLDELAIRPDLRRTKLCAKLPNCTRPRCMYAHSLEEMHAALQETAAGRDLMALERDNRERTIPQAHQVHHQEQASLLSQYQVQRETFNFAQNAILSDMEMLTSLSSLLSSNLEEQKHRLLSPSGSLPTAPSSSSFRAHPQEVQEEEARRSFLNLNFEGCGAPSASPRSSENLLGLDESSALLSSLLAAVASPQSGVSGETKGSSSE